jgi:hypothetical protein
MKPRLYLWIAMAVVLLGFLAYVRNEHTQRIASEAKAKVYQEESHAAKQRETQATACADASGVLAAKWEREYGDLKSKFTALPPDPGPHPVPPNVPAEDIIRELHGLGLAPVRVGDSVALGLSLPDARTTLGWGREAQRVGPLAERLDVCMALTRAQEGATGALHSQVDGLQSALLACDDRATAEQRRADASQDALRRTGTPRNWSVGLLVGLDTQAQRHLGAYVGYSYRAVEVKALFINNTGALGAGIRF